MITLIIKIIMMMMSLYVDGRLLKHYNELTSKL